MLITEVIKLISRQKKFVVVKSKIHLECPGHPQKIRYAKLLQKSMLSFLSPHKHNVMIGRTMLLRIQINYNHAWLVEIIVGSK